jgi:hypothetical protein
MLIADSFAGFIGRVDLENKRRTQRDPTLAHNEVSLTTIWVEYPPWVIVPSSSTPRYENTLPCINGGQHVRVPEIPHLWLTIIAGLL